MEEIENVEIHRLKKTSDMYQHILDYVNNTQLCGNKNGFYHHSFRGYEVDQIFKVYRHEEVERFQPFEQNYNRQLLVHGTALRNVVGILKHGFKVAPTEAISTGSIFGKGIYFADAVAKSLPYCRSDRYALIFLCEVALGMVDIRYKTDHSPLKDRCETVQALGDNYPSPLHIHSDGVKIPNGQLVKRKESTGIPFNEFIVSDVARVKIRYMVKLKMKR